MKKLIYLIVLIVALSLIIAGCGIPVVPPAEQNEPESLPNRATLNASDYSSIQAAIDAANPGDTISVGPGTYDEGSLVFKENNITLIGSGAGTTTIITSSSTYGISVPSGIDDIIIKDFTIQEDAVNNSDTCPSGTSRFHLKISHNSGFTLENVILLGPGRLNSCITGLDLNTVQDVTIKNVEITGYSKNGVSINAKQSSGDSYSSHGIKFEDITISDNGCSTGWAGIAFYTTSTGFVTGDIDSVEFSETNTISNNPMGIYVENFGGDVSITGTGITTLSGNDIPLVATKFQGIPSLSIVDVYAKDVFNVPVRLEDAFASPPNSFLISYWHDVTSAGVAANNPLADGNPVIFNLTDGEWYVVEGMSIQAAVDAASNGDTINVTAGTYTNDPYDSSLSIPYSYRITKSITLLGAHAGNDSAGSTDRGEETILVRTNGTPYSLYAPGITIDGFTFTSGGGSGGGRLIIGGNNVTIKNCIIKDISGTDPHGVYIWPGAIDALIEYNTFFNTAWEAIAGWQVSDAVISHNYISASGQHAIQMMGHAGSDNEISYNHISGIVGKNAIQYWGGSRANISYNVIDGEDTMYDGIWLDAAAHGSTVSNNQIFDIIYAGINVRGGCTDAFVTLNDISGCGTGIENYGDATGASVNYNNIAGNSWGVSNYDAGILNATLNWWGDCSGPTHTENPDGTGDSVSANVDYNPWLGKQLCDLKSAIAALSDDDFSKPNAASDQRQALLDKIDAVCDQYDDSSYRGALNKLQHDVIKKLEKWLVESSELIGMVNDEIVILGNFL